MGLKTYFRLQIFADNIHATTITEYIGNHKPSPVIDSLLIATSNALIKKYEEDKWLDSMCQ